ncbi:hypothetical protein E3T37_16165 [Cryobacterium sp. TMT2-10]|uniref:hypothetical protein n=1 Tax=Cryobacterium sp. TMT2-10 TaxID=1259244 RepID=UPI00106D2F31|nr:hypothetical protein [Cryobacterium sp. TMT2-10]TFD34990.1 hypothetical protein E3T37_16165 [Cryobacterium sp. TMT2-10]
MAARDVRPSRDGDQFHYFWAAQRALEMLLPQSDMAAITVEGTVESEQIDNDSVDVIDLAEYRGSEFLANCTAVTYRQLKHSTLRVEKDWTPSELKSTLSGFAGYYKRLREEFPALPFDLQFQFVSNRRVGSNTLQAMQTIRDRGADTKASIKLRGFANLPAEWTGDFFDRLSIDDRAPSLLPLIEQVESSVTQFLPGTNSDSVLRLKEAVGRRATSLDRSPIRRMDVFAVLGATEDEVLPAPPRFPEPKRVIEREESARIVAEISAVSVPVVLHASGGTGKSIFTRGLSRLVDPRDVVVAYDCFGGGGYRQRSEPRHEARQGLVQLANEMSAHGLCLPLVPNSTASDSQFMAAFMKRIKGASPLLQERGSKLWIVIDAADNAIMAAREFGQRAFVLDLVRELFPHEVRLVFLCRTERVGLLELPSRVKRIPLTSFTFGESGEHLRSYFPSATASDIDEFHTMTAGNPRVQSTLMDQSATLSECLLRLGGRHPNTDEALDALFDAQLGDMRDALGVESVAMDRVCHVLSVLRPRLPIVAIARLASVEPEFVMSFASDFGPGIAVSAQSLQFRDEPTETYFRKNLKPSADKLDHLVAQLSTLAAESTYAAASLPQLLWETNRLDALIELALSSESLPLGHHVQAQEIDQIRTEFALFAALRSGRFADTGRLAFRLGTVTGGQTRRNKLLALNADLAGEFLGREIIEDLFASRALDGGHPGFGASHEGVMLSMLKDTGAARSRLRSAANWMSSWSRLPSNLRTQRSVTDDDIAEVAFGLLMTDGAEAATRFISSWTPLATSFHAGASVTARLIDRGQVRSVTDLVEAARGNAHLHLGIASELHRSGIMLGREAAQSFAASFSQRRKRLEIPTKYYGESQGAVYAGVCGVISSCIHHGTMKPSKALSILKQYLPGTPPRDISDEHSRSPLSLLQAYALRANLERRPLTPADVADDRLQELLNLAHSSDRAVEQFRSNVLPLLPWLDAWAQLLLSTTSSLESTYGPLIESLPKSISDYRRPKQFLDAVTQLLATAAAGPGVVKILDDWLSTPGQLQWWGTSIHVIRVIGLVETQSDTAMKLKDELSARITDSHDNAEQVGTSLFDLARAIYATSRDEAGDLVSKALERASVIGYEVGPTWIAVSESARRAGLAESNDDTRAYATARVAEALIPYAEEGLYPPHMIEAVANLSLRSALAIGSRWRDRRFADFGDVMDKILECERAQRVPLSTRLAFTLLGSNSSPGKVLADDATGSSPDAQDLFDFAVTNCMERGQHPGSDASLTNFARLHGLPLDPFIEVALEPTTVSSFDRNDNWRAEHDAQIESALGALRTRDISNDEGRVSTLMWINRSKVLRPKDLFRFVLHGPRSEWLPFVRSMHEAQALGLYDLGTLFEELAATLELPQALMSYLHRMIPETVVRFARDVVTSSGTPLPIGIMASLSGLASNELWSTALRAFGESSSGIESEKAFALARVATSVVGAADAAKVLDYELEQLEYLIRTDTADGEWCDSLEPPVDILESFAGLLWAALADPEEATRWRAAHVVLNLLRLSDVAALTALAQRAQAQEPEPFIDQGLPFYDLHAVLWLLHALHRHSADSETHLALFRDWIEWILGDLGDHPMLVALASEVLANANLAPEKEPGESAVSMRVIELERFQRPRALRSMYDRSETEFRFDWDFREYWLEPLAECFDVDVEDVERIASHIVLERWDANREGKSNDPRRQRGIMRAEDFRYYKYEWPAAHDQDFYMSYHAMLLTAGHLARTKQHYREPGSKRTDYELWLRRLGLTRDDGRWLSDARGPVPSGVTHSTSRSSSSDWRWNVSSHEFFDVISPIGSDQITVWQFASARSYGKSERVSVRSALADPATSSALVRSLQIDRGRSDFQVPEFGGALEVRHGLFRFTGWVDYESREARFDKGDPLSGEVHFPPPRPAAAFVRLFGLHRDADYRTWSTPEGIAVLNAQTWRNVDKGPNARGFEGTRLTVSADVLDSALEKLGRDLIVEVCIGRDLEKGSYSGRDGDSMDFLEDYFKVFRYQSGRGWSDYKSSAGARA